LAQIAIFCRKLARIAEKGDDINPQVSILSIAFSAFDLLKTFYPRIMEPIGDQQFILSIIGFNCINSHILKLLKNLIKFFSVHNGRK
jgi:hypothetical protein